MMNEEIFLLPLMVITKMRFNYGKKYKMAFERHCMTGTVYVMYMDMQESGLKCA